jgi:hypothetical protein
MSLITKRLSCWLHQQTSDHTNWVSRPDDMESIKVLWGGGWEHAEVAGEKIVMYSVQLH